MLSTIVHFLRCGFWCKHSICLSFVYLKQETFVYQEEEQLTLTGCLLGPHVGYQVRACWSWHRNLFSGPHVDLCFDLSFFMGIISWLYQNQGLIFFICAPDTEVNMNSYSNISWTACYTCSKYWFLICLTFTNLLLYNLLLTISTWVIFRYFCITFLLLHLLA